MTDLSYLLLRLVAGVSLFGHGLVRLPKLVGFSQWMTGAFAKSMLPLHLVRPFSYVLPIAEFTIGLLLMLGLFSGKAILAGIIVMLLLIFGTCMIENWEALPSQIIHALVLILLLQFVASNNISLDKLLSK
ncbi:DoxX family membrane protein [Chitinophaga sp.]|uniref:DoxX family protein n=1 Tax=Chitinophaga sp. TaxID=1869181 RepID=UPI0031D421CA